MADHLTGMAWASLKAARVHASGDVVMVGRNRRPAICVRPWKRSVHLRSVARGMTCLRARRESERHHCTGVVRPRNRVTAARKTTVSGLE